ncbi:hypothetical protein BD626DRAFT_626238 [Schizophyllum amplum]|uniref:Uncharacterized protein n=1 Tax=Schizophyllum amplum TaxID=97359 RepID=A0A550CSS3_9AGAR|nr:hypothetical protein BD626DRAFT_626238 [Auriculariopsis ampla]
MPELRELKIEAAKINNFTQRELESERTVDTLCYDRTIDESAKAPSHCAGRHGHVEELLASSSVLRGQKANQTHLFPTLYASKDDVPIRNHGLVLLRAQATPRSVLLEFRAADGGSLWTEIQYFQHTVSQIYTLDEWDDGVKQVPCQPEKPGVEGRGFRVSLAFVFKNYVLSFNSLDNITQFHWARSRDELGHRYLDVLQPGNLLQLEENVRRWVLRRRRGNADRTCFAVDRVRSALTDDNSPLFPGLPPNITEEELCDDDNGGRLGRLVAAYFSFVKAADLTAWTFIRPYMHHYLLAVTQEQRRDYEKRELRVYGRDESCTTNRYGAALSAAKEFWVTQSEQRKDMEPCDVIAHWIRRPGACPFDPFEPNDVCHALTMNDASNPGPLIFGPDRWRTLAQSQLCLTEDACSGLNPIARLFCDPEQVEWLIGRGHDPTYSHLNLDLYSVLFTEEGKNKRRFGTQVYDFTCDIWSCIPPYPHLSQPVGSVEQLRERKERHQEELANARCRAEQEKQQYDTERARAAADADQKARGEISARPSRRCTRNVSSQVALSTFLQSLPDDGTTWRTFYHDPLIPSKGKGRLFSADERRTRLIRYNVAHHYKKYTVGPLDFCGVARKVKCGTVYK